MNYFFFCAKVSRGVEDHFVGTPTTKTRNLAHVGIIPNKIRSLFSPSNWKTLVRIPAGWDVFSRLTQLLVLRSLSVEKERVWSLRNLFLILCKSAKLRGLRTCPLVPAGPVPFRRPSRTRTGRSRGRYTSFLARTTDERAPPKLRESTTLRTSLSPKPYDDRLSTNDRQDVLVDTCKRFFGVFHRKHFDSKPLNSAPWVV